MKYGANVEKKIEINYQICVKDIKRGRFCIILVETVLRLQNYCYLSITTSVFWHFDESPLHPIDTDQLSERIANESAIALAGHR